MTNISDREMLKALGYGEDYSKKLNDALEATVHLFKEHADLRLSHQ